MAGGRRIVKALLVDLDDTLLDYSGGVDESWLRACETVAGPAGLDPAALALAIARTRRWFWDDPDRHRHERVDMPGAWRKIAAAALERVGSPDGRLAAAIAEAFAARRRAAMRLFPGVPGSLARLRERQTRLALVTNGDRREQRDKIERHDLARFFDVILIEGELGRGKPDAEVYRWALEGLGAVASEAWMVGDHLEFDVAAPQRLGLRAAWVDREGRGVPEPSPVRPDRVIRTFTQLVAGDSGPEPEDEGAPPG